MSIAVDQTRLRRIVETLLPRGSLEPVEAEIMLQLVQLAAGADGADVAAEHSIVQSIGQRITALAGLRVGDVIPSAPIDDELQRLESLRLLGADLGSREARELTYAFVFLTVVADLVLTPSERDALEQFQTALGIDHARATDLVVFLTDIVAVSDAVA